MYLRCFKIYTHYFKTNTIVILYIYRHTHKIKLSKRDLGVCYAGSAGRHTGGKH